MTPLFTKLRYEPGMRVCILGAPSGFSAEIARLPKTVTCATALRGRFDLVHAFFTRQSDLQRSAKKLRSALEADGILWASYPKGDAIATDLKRDVVHDTLEGAGFHCVAQVAIDDLWSAMRFKLEHSD